jgi:hypothetical protein
VGFFACVWGPLSQSWLFFWQRSKHELFFFGSPYFWAPWKRNPTKIRWTSPPLPILIWCKFGQGRISSPNLGVKTLVANLKCWQKKRSWWPNCLRGPVKKIPPPYMANPPLSMGIHDKFQSCYMFFVFFDNKFWKSALFLKFA